MLVALFAGFKDNGRVSFFEEDEADYRVEDADDGEDPKYPSPA